MVKPHEKGMNGSSQKECRVRKKAKNLRSSFGFFTFISNRYNIDHLLDAEQMCYDVESKLADVGLAKSPSLCASCIAGSRSSEGRGRKANIRELKTCSATAAPYKSVKVVS